MACDNVTSCPITSSLLADAADYRNPSARVNDVRLFVTFEPNRLPWYDVGVPLKNASRKTTSLFNNQKDEAKSQPKEASSASQ